SLAWLCPSCVRVSSPSSLFLLLPPPPRPTLFPYTTLFRSDRRDGTRDRAGVRRGGRHPLERLLDAARRDQLHGTGDLLGRLGRRSEEHTSELQSRENLVCRLLLEKKKKMKKNREESQTNGR